MTRATLSNLKTVVAAETGGAGVSDIPGDVHLGALGVDSRRLAHRLGVSLDEPAKITLTEFASAVDAAGAMGVLSQLAFDARIQRLIGVMRASAHKMPAIADFGAWWNELVTQVIWWHCAELVEGGKALVQADIPAEAAAILIKTGVCDRQGLLEAPEANRVTMVDLLSRFGIETEQAGTIFEELSGFAAALDREKGGLQALVRRHANRMADELTQEFAAVINNQDGNQKRVLRAWLSTMTRLPISVWSPSTMDFVNKFRPLGLGEDRLEAIAEEAGIDTVGVDEALSDFYESLCLTCDPTDPDDRHCVRKFSEIGWEAECVDPADVGRIGDGG